MATGNYNAPEDALVDIDWDEVGNSDTNDMMDGAPMNTVLLQNVITMLNQAKAQGCGYTVDEAWNTLKSGAAIQDLMELAEQLDLNVVQINWLWDNSESFQAIQSFLTTHPNDIAAKQTAISLIDLARQGKFPNFNEEDFIDPALYIDFVVNLAMVKVEHPTWNSAQIYLEATWRTISGVVHTALDICGLIPAGGEPCDLVNGVIYAIEGEGMNATLSFAAAIPFLGWPSTGAKYAEVAVQTASGALRKLRLEVVGSVITFGQRDVLRSVMNITDPLNDAHHIIPWGKQTDPLVQLAAKADDIPYHMNHIKNGKEVKKLRFDIPDGIHANHPQYDVKVQNWLTSIWDDLVDDFGGAANIPPNEASQRLRELQNYIGGIIDANPTVKINDLQF